MSTSSPGRLGSSAISFQIKWEQALWTVSTRSALSRLSRSSVLWVCDTTLPNSFHQEPQPCPCSQPEAVTATSCSGTTASPAGSDFQLQLQGLWFKLYWWWPSAELCPSALPNATQRLYCSRNTAKLCTSASTQRAKHAKSGQLSLIFYVLW